MGNSAKESKNKLVNAGKKVVQGIENLFGMNNQTCAKCKNIFSSDKKHQIDGKAYC